MCQRFDHMSRRNNNYYRHMPVHTRTGMHLGRVEDVSHAGDYVHVQQGHLLVRDWYVPASAIAGTDERGLHLDVTLEQMSTYGWTVPPASYIMQQGATPGYEYRADTDIPDYQ
ncbi:MAG: hypothetical protein NVSMB22_19160 [Chloroflexota bacterium]